MIASITPGPTPQLSSDRTLPHLRPHGPGHVHASHDADQDDLEAVAAAQVSSATTATVSTTAQPGEPIESPVPLPPSSLYDASGSGTIPDNGSTFSALA